MVIIDGRKMEDRDHLHAYLKEALHLSDHYGENLDALWDELSERADMDLVFLHADEAIDALGEYGLSLRALFEELNQKSEGFRLYFQIPD